MEDLKGLFSPENTGAVIGVENSVVEQGQTYPILGMITGVISEDGPEIIIELNNKIHAKLQINDSTRALAVKKRAFESGIFVSTVVETSPRLLVECKMIIFGKTQAHWV